ncbi:MAG: peptidylprolyl isomerase [Flavobacteriaceae bacterium]|nr:peptidylprolyl isomerase [Flavobacteriaceae bacterium]|tara:strand:+ start:45445 stop:45927 length:483 start_codon:yes stop_codon:yes gene_type:complete
MRLKKLFYLLMISFTFACSSNSGVEIEEEPSSDYDAINEQEILDYLADNNLTATKSASGLYYHIEDEGTGDFPNADASVVVWYKMELIDGTVIEEAPTDGFIFGLWQVIPGFAEAVRYLREGGTINAYVPSKLGYGDMSYRSIPANAVLIFKIKLLRVGN